MVRKKKCLIVEVDIQLNIENYVEPTEPDIAVEF